MKKQTYSFLLLFLLMGFLAPAQSVPVVPEQVLFADITVELDPNARKIIQQDVNSLMSNQQYWTAKLDRVVLYFPLIESILISEGVPTDFKYLAVQESSLTPDAVSTSSAVGYWQFKRETATDNGLRVDDAIDERKSITASTKAAATYLKKSNAQFNNWVASLYSYYLGAGGISKLIPPDWAYAREIALDGNTDRYILRFFAHKIAIENALKFHQTNNRFALIEYTKGSGKTMRSIAEELNIDEFDLRKYNRWILGDAVPTDKVYVMVIPVASSQLNDVRQKIGNASTGKGQEVAQTDVGFPVLRRVTSTRPGKNDPVLYEINGLPGIQDQTGDNLASLARKAKISVSSFMRYNDMDDSDPIIVNDIYYLAKKRKKALVPFHTVRDGETSRSISQRYGLRLKKLLRFNRLDRGQQLATGRVMWLREKRPANRPIEIITSPTAPVYDPTPAPPTPADIAMNEPANRRTDSRTVSGSDNIPRKASERKRYRPKLMDGGITPNDGSAAPATAPPETQPATTVNTVSTSRPAPAGSAEGSQRVVIVRSPDASGVTKTVPVATTPDVVDKAKASSAEDGWRPAGTKSGDASQAYNRIPKKPARPASDDNQGPDEQQADGSITTLETKTPARTTAPVMTKAEPRPAPAPIKETMEKPVKKAIEPMMTMPEKKPAPAQPATTSRAMTTHVVQKGETYYGIAREHGMSLTELLELNDRTLSNNLEIGQRLKVPSMDGKSEPAATKVTESPSAKSAPASTPSGMTFHTVEKGENLFRISKQYNVSVAELQEWNNLSTAYVRVGQKIRVTKP